MSRHSSDTLRKALQKKTAEGGCGYCVFSEASVLDFGVIRAHLETSLKVKIHNPTARRVLIRVLVDEGSSDSVAVERDAEYFRRLGVRTDADVAAAADVCKISSSQIEALEGDELDAYANSEAAEEIDFTHLSKEDPLVAPTFESCALCKCTAVASGSVQARCSINITPEVALVVPGATLLAKVHLKAGHKDERTQQFLHLRPFGWWQQKTGYETLVRSIEIQAEIQLPRILLSTTNLNWDKAYAGIVSEPRSIVLQNPTDLPTSFEWMQGEEDDNKLMTIEFEPRSAVLPGRQTVSINVTIVAAESLFEPSNIHKPAARRHDSAPIPIHGSAMLKCPDAIDQPRLVVSATAFGPSIELAVLDPSGNDGETGVDGGEDEVALNFAPLEIMKDSTLKLLLTNTSAIPMQLEAWMLEYRPPPSPPRTLPENDPERGQEVTERTARGGQMLLDDAHERIKFRGSTPSVSAPVSPTEHTNGIYSFILNPSSSRLEPFATTQLECTINSTAAFEMVDKLCIRLDKMAEYRVPVTCRFFGCPLQIPSKQVAVDDEASPKMLSIAQLAFKQGASTRHLVVANCSNCAVELEWEVYTNDAIERHVGRHTIIPVDKGHTIEPSRSVDPSGNGYDNALPVVVSPSKALLPGPGSVKFTITMRGDRMGIQKYRLVGSGSYRIESAESIREREESSRLRRCMKTLVDDGPSQVRQLGADPQAAQTSKRSPSSKEDSESEAVKWSKAAAFVSGTKAGTVAVVVCGEVIAPALEVDKKADKDGKRRFQFFHHPHIASEEEQPWGIIPSPRANRFYNRIYRRSVCYTNTSKTPIICRFRCFTETGPSKAEHFRIRMIDVRRIRPRRFEGDADAGREFYKIWPQESAVVSVVFVPPEPEDLHLHAERSELDEAIEERMDHWRPAVGVLGCLVVDYPQDGEVTGRCNQERVELIATCTLPDLNVIVREEVHNEPPLVISPQVYVSPFENKSVVMDFGIRNVHSIVENVRELVLSARSFVPCVWKLRYVGSEGIKQELKGKTRLTMAEAETLRSADDASVFEISNEGGIVHGPTVPFRKLPLPAKLVGESVMPRAQQHFDSERYQPAKIQIRFRPKEAIFYRSRFRVHCLHGGRPTDVILQGCGSFDEQDDLRIDAGLLIGEQKATPAAWAGM
ncbi:Deleted in lung and esophageal cancer 1 [Perkinsus olseni]|uniref:Deleted in lung and esophageal cancer 1 n=1 Tax=Perkinsus olseni TaxID=32597 RepID=A0A7J6LKP9_PEROL|nr:Deleted in lung and esophageal cancer 1 [Perkinsus olseni]